MTAIVPAFTCRDHFDCREFDDSAFPYTTSAWTPAADEFPLAADPELRRVLAYWAFRERYGAAPGAPELPSNSKG
jgi:hypothetical protein